MLTILILLLILMILGAIVALEGRDLLSAVISLGIVGFALVLVFLILQAPDLAIVQIVVETLALIILIAAILKTTREDTAETRGVRKIFIYLCGLGFLGLFLFFVNQAFRELPQFGHPIMRMARNYLSLGLTKTGASNLVAAVILDFRGYDTLGEATVLFTAVMGVIAVLRKIGRRTRE
ncbi:MAG: hydrogen gas-evolving membrane-bound hydrogenase subunit E [bacterium]